ncbi:MAG: glycoside hydrolase domain-containing protein [Oligosphaeraceae bacterium]
MKCRCFSLLVLLAAHLSLTALETLHWDFSRERSVVVGGVAQVPEEGMWRSGELAVGSRGLGLPAAPLLGENEGTILFRVRFEEPREPRHTMRSLVTLRTSSRLYAGFYFFGDRRWAFAFSDQDKTFRMEMPEPLAPGEEYSLGFSWDGQRLRLFRDGRILAETEQPLPVEKVTRLNLGPYQDGWIATNPWCDDTFLRELRVFSHALEPQEAAAYSGVSFRPLAENVPPLLTVPPLPAGVAPPEADGQLSEEAWAHAAGTGRLVQGNYPQVSGELPSHDFRLCYDAQNLYVGFYTRFPPHQPFVEGDLRSSQKEPEVWGSESVEVYLETDALYRFAGNMAGGYCEGRQTDGAWNGEWTYRCTKAMKMDDSILWEGEMVIPWKTVGLDGPPGNPLRLNCCRSWKLPDFGQPSSLKLKSDSYGPEEMIPVSFGPCAILQILEESNPNQGEYHQRFRLESAQGGELAYQVALAKLDGSALPLPLYDRTWKARAGETIQESFSLSLSQADYDCLLYTLSRNGEVAWRRIIPFQLDLTFFTVTPLFFQEKLRVNLKEALMRRQLGEAGPGEFQLLSPSGELLSSLPVAGSRRELPFSRQFPPGKYTVVLTDGQGNPRAAQPVEYPGIGEWESQSFPQEIILPPFTPMDSRREGEKGLLCQVSQREYRWAGSALPGQLTSQGVPMLAGPVELLLGGEEAPLETFQVVSQAPHRVEFRSQGREFRCDSWLEYDGVQWNRLTLTPRGGKSLAIRLRMTNHDAKFLHGAAGGGIWGAKTTMRIPQGTTTLPFYYSLWIGNEERGVCVFAENRKNWTVPSKDTFLVERDETHTTLTIRIAHALPGDASTEISLGFLATPIRPLAPNYPFDTFTWSYSAPMNQDGLPHPTQDVVIIDAPYGVYRGDLGSYFADTRDRDGDACANSYLQAFRRQTDGHHVRPVPYLCGRYLSAKYPEMRAYRAEWSFRPELAQDYDNTGHFIYDCCPVSSASAFFAWKVRELLRRFPQMKGLYFDFGNVPECANTEHGCQGGAPLLAQREFYRRMALVQLQEGIESPVIVLHNTDCNLLPTYTFVSHLFNGEHIRQSSSTLLHDKKDILDTYGLEMFASELSTLPFGVTNSVYMPLDTLRPEYGGDEPTDVYQFRLGKAEHAATLLHNTLISPMRNHYGLFDKIVQTLARFGVGEPDCRFLGYWRHPVSVEGAKEVYVSCHVRGERVLAVVGHVGKAHDNQTFTLTFDWDALGISTPPTKVVERMTEDLGSQELWRRQKEFSVPPERAPLPWGDLGVKIHSFQGNTLRMSLDFHSFAILELQ